MASDDAFKVSLLTLNFKVSLFTLNRHGKPMLPCVFITKSAWKQLNYSLFIHGKVLHGHPIDVPFCVCTLGVLPEGEGDPDNGCQLRHRGRYERPVRQTRSPAGPQRPRRGKPQQNSQAVHRLRSCRGTNPRTELGHRATHVTFD